MIVRGKLVVGIALAGPLALSLVGCAGKGRVSSARMCQAHGGTYNPTAQTCSYTASTRSARDICQAQGGYYNTAAQYCEIGRD
jgi:hypothetical protein